jgi:hypothetical protein
VLVAQLAELDTRDAHLRAGHGSLFAFCRDALALSEQDAYGRIAAARAVRRYPVILERLESGALNLTTVRLLAPHLTPENHLSVLDRARGRTRLQVEELAASLAPLPDAPSIVRRLPVPTTASGPADRAAVPGSIPPAACSWPAARAGVTPLAPDRYRVQVTIGGKTLGKLRRAQELLRHAVPSGSEALVLDRALTVLLDDLSRRRFAATERPRPAGAARPGSRSIPADVKRRVWLRDLGRCAFVATSGRRCNERSFLEFHHVQPYALGGEPTLSNIELRCRSHNAYEARLWFGGARAAGNGNNRPEAEPGG